DVGNPGRAADENHLVDLRRGQPGVLECRATAVDAAVDVRANEFLEFGPGEGAAELPGSVAVPAAGDAHAHLGTVRGTERDLRLLRRVPQVLQKLRVLRRQID